MNHKYYTGEQILDALSEVGVGAGDISEVMSCLGRKELNNNSTKVDRKNDNLIRIQDAIDAMYDLVDGTKRPENQKGNPHIYQIVDALQKLPSAEPDVPDINVGDMISRQGAIDAVNAYLGLSSVSRTIQNMMTIQEILEKLPSAEKTAKWLYGDREYICSECGWSHTLPMPDNYCPNCGAKMGV